MIIYKKIFAFNMIKKACSELFGVITVVLEYTDDKQKIPSFDKKKPLYCLFINLTHYLNK